MAIRELGSTEFVLADFVAARLDEEQVSRPPGVRAWLRHWNMHRQWGNRRKVLRKFRDTGRGERAVVYLARLYQAHPDFPIEWRRNTS